MTSPSDNQELLHHVPNLARELTARVAEHYRYLHRYPELAWAEEKTAAYVEKVLREAGYNTDRVAGTGVVAELEGSGILPCRALRADLDAIAVTEKTGLPFASETHGKMHGCGHDAHTAIVLGVAELLRRLDEPPPRSVRFLFQPAEEVDPSGARECLAAAVLDGVSDIVSLHVWPALATGLVGVRDGAVTAAADRWECELRGPGGHAARPHEAVDLVALAARAVTSLLAIPREHVDLVGTPTVVTVANIHAGASFNVIPDHLVFGGTVRTLDREARALVASVMERVVRGVCDPAGAEVCWTYNQGAPALINSPSLTTQARDVVTQLLGSEAVVALERPSMGSEDFSYFTEQTPGLLLRLGCTRAGETEHPLHSSHFVVDEEALAVGVSVLSGLALT